MKTHIKVRTGVIVACVVSVMGLTPAIAATAQYGGNGNAAQVTPPPAGIISARDVPDPKNTLASAKIIDLAGNSVGSVGEVMLDATGKPTSLKVDVGGSWALVQKTWR
jgi:hypothetical protein